MTLLAVMAVLAVFAVGLLAVAPSVQQMVQREKELEAISRGEEVQEAIRQYVEFYGGSKLPSSMKDLLDGLPQGTKKRMILRPSAAVDPLTEDGKWRLIKPDPQIIGKFARRVQNYNGGVLPPSPTQFDRFAIVIVNNLNTGDKEDVEDPDSFDDFDVETEDTPFIGIASQSKMRSVIAYYGIENHSKWIFTPLFRGTGRNSSPRLSGGGPGGGGGPAPVPPGK
jgi:type II secretory pathway pseudopilin PulG